MRKEEEDLYVSLAKHDLESALHNLEKCDMRVPTLGEACTHMRQALEFINEDIELCGRKES